MKTGKINNLCFNPFFQPEKGDQKLRFHVFGPPQTPSHRDFSGCAYGQKTRFLPWMLKSVGHTVYHYGNELSVDKKHPERGVICDEHISVTTEVQLMDAYPNCREDRGVIDYLNPEYPESTQYLNEIYCINAAYEARKRYEKGDYFCYLAAPQELYNRLVDLPVQHIEAGIGYVAKPYLPYKIFESKAIRGWHYGAFASDYDYYMGLSEEDKVNYPYNPNNHIPFHAVPLYDVVIPSAIDVRDFDFRIKKEDDLLYLGRIHKEKGIDIAIEIAKRAGKKLLIAGTGDFEKEFGKPPNHVELLGPVGPDQRRELLSKASALLLLSVCWEGFGTAAIEAMASGTPPITSDYGGLIDIVRSGYNGYRVSMNKVEEGVWACQNVDKLDPYNLRDYGLRFSLEQNALRYNQYFQNLKRGVDADGDFNSVENPHRENLDWIDFDYRVDWPSDWLQPIDTEGDKGEKSSDT